MLLAFVLNFSFSVLELVGGIVTNSISIISDAVHDLGDSVSIGTSLALEYKSTGKPDRQYTYGYLRYSVLGALITAVILFLGSAFVIYQSVCRLIAPSAVNYDGMLILAVIGIAVNGLAAYRTARGHSMNEKTLSLHMLEDVLGWGAVLIGSFVIKFTGWHWIDPMLSLGIAVFVLFHAFGHMRRVLFVLMEKAPSEICVDNLVRELQSVEKVRDIHHMHLWSMDGNAHFASLHALIEENTTHTEFEALKRELRHILKSHCVVHSTIELEYSPCDDQYCHPEVDTHEHHHCH